MLVSSPLLLTEERRPREPRLQTPSHLVSMHPEVRQITTLLTELYAAKETRNLSSCMQFFWKSPLVAYLTEDAVAIGWDQVKAKIAREFSARPAPAHAILERLRTNLPDDRTALTVEWWTLVFPLGNTSGFTSCTWHKFPEGWRIIQAHTDATAWPEAGLRVPPLHCGIGRTRHLQRGLTASGDVGPDHHRQGQ